MAQSARSIASRNSGVGTPDRAKHRVSEVVPQAVLLMASTRPKAFRSGDSYHSAKPLLETETAFRSRSGLSSGVQTGSDAHLVQSRG